MRFPKSLVARIGAVAATAAIAVTGATSAASAATAAPAATATAAHYVHRIPTKLAISNTLPKGHYPNRTVLINGHLTAGKYNLRHLRVFLVRRGYKGHWYVVQSQLTAKYGHVLFRRAPRQEARELPACLPRHQELCPFGEQGQDPLLVPDGTVPDGTAPAGSPGWLT